MRRAKLNQTTHDQKSFLILRDITVKFASTNICQYLIKH